MTSEAPFFCGYLHYVIMRQKMIVHLVMHIQRIKTYTLKKSMTSGDNGEAPDAIKRTRPPSLSFILLKTNLSHIGDGFRPELIVLYNSRTK